MLMRKGNKTPSDNHLLPRQPPRRNNRDAQVKEQNHWLDTWLSRASHFSQFGLFVVTLGSLYFVVLPLYQKSVLDEAIARKEIELKESEKLIEKSYEKLRSFAIQKFVFNAGAMCTISQRKINTQTSHKEENQRNDESILNLNITRCLNEELNASQVFKELRSNDQVFFSKEVKNVAEKLEQRRIVAVQQYRELPGKAKLDPSLLKPPKYFSGSLIKYWEELNKKTHLISDASLDEQRFRAGVQAAQSDVEYEYGDFARTQLLGLRSLTWSSPK